MSMEMEVIQSSSSEDNQIQLRKSNECEQQNYRNKIHTVKVFEMLQSLRKYVIKVIK